MASSTLESVTSVSDQSSESLSSEPIDSETADRAEIEQVWRDFWALRDRLSKVAQADREALVDQVAIDPAKTELLSSAANFEASGLEIYGQAVLHPYWTDPVNGQSTAQMGDCMDSSGAGAQYIATGQKKTVGVANNNTIGGFTKGDDGQWRVRQVLYPTNIPCEPTP